MPTLVTMTGPIAAGKNTVASSLAELCHRADLSVVVADVDDVAAMVCPPGAGAAGLWFAAHEAHGVLVGQWMRSQADVVISVGPVYTEAEQDALYDQLPPGAQVLRVLIDAPLSTTWARVRADRRSGASGRRDFHEAAHARFQGLKPGIPADLRFDSADKPAATISAEIYAAARLPS